MDHPMTRVPWGRCDCPPNSIRKQSLQVTTNIPRPDSCHGQWPARLLEEKTVNNWSRNNRIISGKNHPSQGMYRQPCIPGNSTRTKRRPKMTDGLQIFPSLLKKIPSMTENFQLTRPLRLSEFDVAFCCLNCVQAIWSRIAANLKVNVKNPTLK